MNLIKKQFLLCILLLVFLQCLLIFSNFSVVSFFTKPFHNIGNLQFWIEDAENASYYKPLPISEIKKFYLLSQQEKVENNFCDFDNFMDRKCFQNLSDNYNLSEYQEDHLYVREEKIADKRTILVWNYFFGRTDIGFGYGDEPFKKGCCKESRCFLTGNRGLIPIEEFDAIIFHFYLLAPRNMPSKRSPHQRWIFYEMEAPAYNMHNPDDFAGIFNWTMTYRIDSDVPTRYGYAHLKQKSPYEEVLLENMTTIRPTNKKLVVWLVSHCKTQSYREYYVKQLQKYIEVDVFGRCGSNSFPKQDTDNFFERIEKTYKFYLSFENALCKDYVTEKFFNALRYNIVPVVYGFADYKSLAPPHSYIDILDFNSMKDVAEYLLYLDRNSTAYNEYFRWKDEYQVFPDNVFVRTMNFCSLCKKLHSDSPKKTYNALREWHVGQAKCKRMRPADWYENLLGITLD